MKNIFPIFKNELRLYFYSWLGWSSFLVINIIAGLGYLFGAVSFGNFQYFYTLLELPFIWAILIVGARSLAKDKEQGLFSLFFTSPVPLKNILIAKFLAIVVFFTVIALLTMIYAFISQMFFNISWMTVLSGFVSLFLSIILFSSIALFASSCADNTLISIVIAFGLWMLVYLLGSLANIVNPNLPIALILKEFSYSFHFKNISSGVFNLSDIFYFIAFPIFMINITESKILAQIAY